MKKIILFSLAFILLGSCGGIIGLAHAQSLTPDQQAQISAQLQADKNELLNLQAQAAAQAASAPVVVVAPAPASAAVLSAQDVAELQGALSALSATLIQVEQIAAAQGGVLTDAQQVAISSALTGISGDLSGIVASINNPVAPIAMTSPTTPAEINMPPAAANVNPAPTGAMADNSGGAPADTSPAAPVDANAVNPQIAVASSNAPASSSTIWIIVGIIVILLLLVIILSRRRRKTYPTTTVATTNYVAPRTPTPTAHNAPMASNSGSSAPVNGNTHQ